MILTVTPNPSLDRTYEVPALDRGEVLRATGDRMDPGGKGVNVSRAVAAAGHRTVAVAAARRRARRTRRRPARRAGHRGRAGPDRRQHPFEHRARRTRRHADEDQRAGPGTHRRRGRSCSLDTVRSPVRRPPTGSPAAAVCRAGSPPPGTPSWSPGATAAGARIALDTSGPALLAALRERPDVVKPNAEELAEAVGRPLATVGDAVKAAEELRELRRPRRSRQPRAPTGSCSSTARVRASRSARVDAVRSNVGRRRRLPRRLPHRGRQRPGRARLGGRPRRGGRPAAGQRDADPGGPRPVGGHHDHRTSPWTDP